MVQFYGIGAKIWKAILIHATNKMIEIIRFDSNFMTQTYVHLPN